MAHSSSRPSEGDAPAPSGASKAAALAAFYYPHTQIRDRDFLKAALLTWDEVNFISPYPGFVLERSTSETVNTALELICRPHTPSDSDKQRVHARLCALLKDGVPSWMTTSAVPDALRSGRQVREYRDANDIGVYPRKLDPKTWDLLEAAGLVRLNDEQHHYTAPLVGFFLMSLLADSCAGETRQKITDRADAYSFLWKMAAVEAAAEYLPSVNARIDSHHSRLVTLSIKVLNTDQIPLENLVAMRLRETRSTSANEYRAMRRRYAAAIQLCAKRLANEARSTADWAEITRQFEIELQDDIKALKSELRLAKMQLVFSKEVGVTALAAASLFLDPVFSNAVLSQTLNAICWSALVSDVIKFKGAYKNALAGHPTSWLYLNARPGRDLFRDLGQV